MPSFSVVVVIPTYRRSHFLPGLIALLEAQTLPLDQFEVVVVDNGSGDDTLEVLGSLQQTSPLNLRVESYTTRQGPAGARNAGWRSSTAPVVAFTDDDCYPDPFWLAAGLEALDADASLGVLQGRTDFPEGAELGTWSVYRQIHGTTALFEGCNLFFRREALEVAGGFDEVSGFYFEDTAAGWAVREAGWRAGYCDGSRVVHPVEDRGFRWHITNGYAEQNVVRVAAQYPGFRDEGCWRPWAHQPDTVKLLMAVLGAGLAFRSSWVAAGLAYPYAKHLWKTAGRRGGVKLMAERIVVDAARTAGHVRGSVDNRTLLL